MNTFSLVVNPTQQSPTVQNWLRAHDDNNFAEGWVDDGIVVHSYQTEDHLYLDYVVFHVKDMIVRRIAGQSILGMLTNRFNWSNARAQRFQVDFGQLLEIHLPGLGSLYYAQVLDIEGCEIRIDFYIKEGRAWR